MSVGLTKFRISYADEADLVAYARSIGFVGRNGDLVTQGDLPDGSGQFFLTPAFRRAVPTGRTVPSAVGMVPETTDDGLWWRTLGITGNNPFEGDSPLPLPPPGIAIHPPGPDQPEVAEIA